MKKQEGVLIFEYKDIDILNSPLGWFEVRLENRFKEGYEIWRDEKNMSWKGKKTNK